MAMGTLGRGTEVRDQSSQCLLKASDETLREISDAEGGLLGASMKVRSLRLRAASMS